MGVGADLTPAESEGKALSASNLLPREATCRRRRQNTGLSHLSQPEALSVSRNGRGKTPATGDLGLRQGPKAAGTGPTGHRTPLRVNSACTRGAARGPGAAAQDALR